MVPTWIVQHDRSPLLNGMATLTLLHGSIHEVWKRTNVILINNLKSSFKIYLEGLKNVRLICNLQVKYGQ